MYSFYGSNAVDATTAAFIRIRDIIRVLPIGRQIILKCLGCLLFTILLSYNIIDNTNAPRGGGEVPPDLQGLLPTLPYAKLRVLEAVLLKVLFSKGNERVQVLRRDVFPQMMLEVIVDPVEKPRHERVVVHAEVPGALCDLVPVVPLRLLYPCRIVEGYSQDVRRDADACTEHEVAKGPEERHHCCQVEQSGGTGGPAVCGPLPASLDFAEV